MRLTRRASMLSASVQQQVNMYAIAVAVVVISLVALTTLFAQPPRTVVTTEAEQPLSFTASNGQNGYLAAVEPLIPGGHCIVDVNGVMTGYCIGGALVCTGKYNPSSCPPGKRVKHVVKDFCDNHMFHIPRYWHTCDFQ